MIINSLGTSSRPIAAAERKSIKFVENRKKGSENKKMTMDGKR